nr:uncharacterized protein LOC103351260 [Oryctolagus cuniculus]
MCRRPGLTVKAAERREAGVRTQGSSVRPADPPSRRHAEHRAPLRGTLGSPPRGGPRAVRAGRARSLRLGRRRERGRGRALGASCSCARGGAGAAAVSQAALGSAELAPLGPVASARPRGRLASGQDLV